MAAFVNRSIPRGRRGHGRRPMSEINVTPFVDVVLVLLIIFMVTAPMITAGVEIDLPESAASALPGQDEPISISVRSDGSVYLQESKVELGALSVKLDAITKANKEARIFVRGDKGVEYGRVMEVMGAINSGGYSKVGLITIPMQRR